jgi:integrase/recombinase XerD
LEHVVNHPLATLCEQFLQERRYLKNVTPSTLVWYEVAFKNYLASIDAETPPLPTKASLLNFVVQQRDRGVRAVTCNTYIGALNAFCRWLHEERHLAEPLKLTKLNVERRVLSLLNDVQLRQWLSFKPKTFHQHRTHLAVCVVLDTGLRVSEVLTLRRDDVDFDNLILKVFGKGRKERLVPFSPELRKRVFRFDQLRVRKGIRGAGVFDGFEGTQWEKRNATTSLYLLQDKLGLPRFGWHRLRHTFATNYLRQGGDIVRLSIVLGHTQITTTQRYLHLLTEDLSASHQKVSILSRLR